MILHLRSAKLQNTLPVYLRLSLMSNVQVVGSDVVCLFLTRNCLHRVPNHANVLAMSTETIPRCKSAIQFLWCCRNHREFCLSPCMVTLQRVSIKKNPSASVMVVYEYKIMFSVCYERYYRPEVIILHVALQ